MAKFEQFMAIRKKAIYTTIIQLMKQDSLKKIWIKIGIVLSLIKTKKQSNNYILKILEILLHLFSLRHDKP